MKPINLVFSKYEDICNYISNASVKGYNSTTIYLLTHEGILEEEDREIFVTHDLAITLDILKSEDVAFEVCTKWHLHEYESFKDAYDVALLIREDHPLCYNKNTNL